MSTCERCWQLGGSTAEGYAAEVKKHHERQHDLLARAEKAETSLAAAEAKLADERKHADELAERVRTVLERDLRIAGDPWCEPALQDEHKTGPSNADTLASLVAAHAARRKEESK